MNIFTLAHIAAGTVALLSGFTALVVKKGARAHRLAGRCFVPSMLFMGLSGATIAAFQGVRISILAGLMVCYLVWSAYVVARKDKGELRRSFLVNAWAGAALSILGSYFLFQAWQLRSMNLDGYPVFMVAVFSGILLIGCIQDAVWARSVQHTPLKLVRYHVWRMGVALWNAASAFFLGQTDEFPRALQQTWLVVPPVLLVVILISYYFARQSWKIWRRSAVAR